MATTKFILPALMNLNQVSTPEFLGKKKKEMVKYNIIN